MDAIDIGGIVWMSFNYLLLVPLMMYSLYQFHLIDSSESIMLYRNKTLVYILNVMMLVTLLIERLYASFIHIWCILDTSYIWMFYLFFSLTWWLSFDLFAIKVYNLYFQQQYNKSIASSSTLESSSSCFYSNKYKYGNIQYCIKLICIPYIITVIINTILYPIFGEGLILDFTQFFIASIPVIFSFIIFYKSRKLNDIYKIRNEILFQCVILVAALLIYLIIFLYIKLLTDFNYQIDNIDNNYYLRIEWLFRNLVADLFAIGLAGIGTIYPVYLYQNKDVYKLKSLMQLQQIQTTTSISNNLSASTSTTTLSGIDAIKNVISDIETYKSFMRYLITEFSCENLLFLTELVQIKHEFQIKNENVIKISSKSLINNTSYAFKIEEHKNNDNKDIFLIDFNVIKNTNNSSVIYTYFLQLLCSNEDLSEIKDNLNMTKICLPLSLRKTLIIQKNPHNFSKQIRLLFNKYIKYGCDHEINIASRLKEILNDYFNDNNNNDLNNNHKQHTLYTIFDECGIEILFLMNDAFQRYVFHENIDLNVTHKVNPDLIMPSIRRQQSCSASAVLTQLRD